MSGKTTKAKAAKAAKKGEVQVSKSPAEFFAENQAIAGFDNMGKSLYTSLRELIENSLDACESINELPNISVSIEEFTQAEFNILHGLTNKGSAGADSKDAELFQKKNSRKSSSGGGGDDTAASNVKDDTTTTIKKPKKRASQEAYFRIKVRDNGCGMRHDDIPDMLGRVLSSSKYGVRQTRGKFGLGAKMALIWSKKSSGVPIRITSSHRLCNNAAGKNPPAKLSHCVLDIDIFKNCPKIIEHTQKNNVDGWVGTEMELLIAGNWTTYKSRIVQYLQQLAIITPYAKLEMTYTNVSDPKRKDMSIRYDRRSEQMPPPAQEVKHHPSSVNNLLVQQLQSRTKTKTLTKFLTNELSAVSAPLAKRLITELGQGFDESMHPSELTDKQITKMVQLLRSVQLFKAPDGSCLSPLGEYNLNLGIRKVLEPTMIATARDKPGAYEGHPFIVEAAVSLGGKNEIAKDGITVVRFANRIPLLFEAGADVSTRVAQTKIRWSNYKMDHKRDKIGVFVSIVSTKIPYKGTGKEYIGDDITEIQQSVKRALQSCCNQLKAHLTKRNAMRDIKERKSRLVKYIPNVGQALIGLLEGMRTRKRLQAGRNNEDDDEDDAAAGPKKKLRLDDAAAEAMIRKLDSKEITEESIRDDLRAAVEAHHAISLEDADDGTGGDKKGGTKNAGGKGNENLVPLFLLPLTNMNDPQHDIQHPLFTFRPFRPVELKQPAEAAAAAKKGNDMDSVLSISD